jgi:hypothetical protein
MQLEISMQVPMNSAKSHSPHLSETSEHSHI